MVEGDILSATHEESSNHHMLAKWGAGAPQRPRFFQAARACLKWQHVGGHSGVPERTDLPIMICSQMGVGPPADPASFKLCIFCCTKDCESSMLALHGFRDKPQDLKFRYNFINITAHGNIAKPKT